MRKTFYFCLHTMLSQHCRYTILFARVFLHLSNIPFFHQSLKKFRIVNKQEKGHCYYLGILKIQTNSMASLSFHDEHCFCCAQKQLSNKFFFEKKSTTKLSLRLLLFVLFVCFIYICIVYKGKTICDII